MLRRDPNYVRIARGRDMAGRASYWLASDHLLVVRDEGFQERYRRFYLRDIQALVVRRTSAALFINLVLGFIMAFCVFGALTSSPVPLVAFLSVVAGVSALFLVINLLMGPTCESTIRTAVQSERLPGMGRLRRSRKLLSALIPAVGETQKDLPVGHAPPLPVEEPAGMSNRGRFSSAPALPVRHYDGRMHAVAFTLMLVDAVMALFYVLLEHTVIEYLNIALTLAELAFIVAAIVKQHGSDMAASVRRVLWVTVIFYGVGIIATFVVGIYIAVSSGTELDVENLRPSQHIALLYLYLVNSAYLLGAGLLGWLFLVLFRRNHHEGGPPPLVGDAPSRGSDVDSAPSPVEPSVPDPVPPASPPPGSGATS